ncbi:MAG: type II secretion system F family protein [Tepidisphaerales bacterium]
MNPPILEYQARQSRFSDYVQRARHSVSLARNAAITLGWLAVAAVIFGCGMGGTIVPCLLIVLATALILRSVRRRRGLAVLGYLDQAMRMNQPLPESLSAAAAGERGFLRRRLYSVRDALVGGVPVGVALEVCVPEVPLVTARLIASAESLGAVRTVLRSIVHNEQTKGERRGDDWFFARFYPLVFASLAAFIVFMLMVFIVPKFERIFRDFKIAPGPWFDGLVFFARNLGFLVLIPLGGYIWLYVALRLWEIFLPRDRQTVWRRVFDWVAWHTPVVAANTRLACLANAMQILAAGVEAGFALPDALLQTMQLRQNGYFTQRLETWHRAMLGGAAPAAAARQARMPGLVAGMLTCSGTDLANTLRFLSMHYAEHYSRAAAVIRAAVIPGMTLAFGAIVFWVAMALFDPLMHLIKAVLPMGGFNL